MQRERELYRAKGLAKQGWTCIWYDCINAGRVQIQLDIIGHIEIELIFIYKFMIEFIRLLFSFEVQGTSKETQKDLAIRPAFTFVGNPVFFLRSSLLYLKMLCTIPKRQSEHQ